MAESNSKIIVYGRVQVSFQKVIWVLEELQVPYEKVETGGYSAPTNPQ